MIGPGQARALLDRVAGALPAAEEETAQGWRLRHTDTSMWWVGAALPHDGPDREPLEARIRAAEEFYATRGVPARFQVCPDCPSGLDAVLDGRGYQTEGPMSLQAAVTAHVADRLGEPRMDVRLSQHPDAAWFQTWQAVHAPDVDPGPEWRLLHSVGRPSGYVCVHADGETVAVGRVVGEGGWAGVFGMATLPHAQGKGAGRAVLAALARWAADRHAARMYLQLEHENAAAQQLYTSAGFTEAFAYHYRTRPSRQ